MRRQDEVVEPMPAPRRPPRPAPAAAHVTTTAPMLVSELSLTTAPSGTASSPIAAPSQTAPFNAPFHALLPRTWRRSIRSQRTVPGDGTDGYRDSARSPVSPSGPMVEAYPWNVPKLPSIRSRSWVEMRRHALSIAAEVMTGEETAADD